MLQWSSPHSQDRNKPASLFRIVRRIFPKNTIKSFEKNSFMVINENIWELGSNYDY